VKSETDPQLSSWYKQNSKIFVSPDHACWIDEDSARKVRKHRFGMVEKSLVTGLGDMLGEYLVSVFSFHLCSLMLFGPVFSSLGLDEEMGVEGYFYWIGR